MSNKATYPTAPELPTLSHDHDETNRKPQANAASGSAAGSDSEAQL